MNRFEFKGAMPAAERLACPMRTGSGWALVSHNIAVQPRKTLNMIKLDVNGKTRDVDLPADMPILWVLRDELGLTGTKFGCGAGLCGACTVHLDGQPIRSCITPISAAVGHKVATIESIESKQLGAAVQAAWVANGVPQCGYCQTGQIMSAVALLERVPNPSDNDIDQAMSGNICRCGTYTRIRATIQQIAATRGGQA